MRAGARLPHASLRAISDEGWLNAWSAHLGVTEKVSDAFLRTRDVAKLGGARAAKAVCSRDGWVAPRRAADTPKPQRAVLAGVVLSDRPRELELRASTSGKVVLLFAGERIELTEMPGREGRALPDERFRHVSLERGANEVFVMIEPETAGFQIRLRELDGRPARGLLYAEGVATAACEPSALLDAGAEVRMKEDGLALALQPRFRGVVPPIDAPSIDVGVRAAKTARPALLELGRSDLVGRPGEVSASLATPERGSFEIEASFGGKPIFSRRMPDYGALVARVAGLVASAREIEEVEALPVGSRASFMKHVASLADAIANAEPDKAWLGRHVERAERLAKRLEDGVDAYTSERGVVHRAYRSALDGALQPYVVFVPKSYDGKSEVPLVVVAHGRDRLPEHALRTLVGEAPNEHMSLAYAAHNLPVMSDLRAIYAAPWGHGNGGVQGVGEQDVLAVIADLKRAYRIDPRRVSLTGYSLGGTVAFALPLHYPDVFSAAAPLCGYPNLLGYQSVAGATHLPWEEVLLQKEYVVRYAENGMHVPLHIVHGGKDGPGRSKVVVDRYKELGYPHIFDIQEEADHNVWDYAYEDARMVPWLTQHRTPWAPARVRLVTGKYRYDRAYWLRLVGMIDGSRADPASIDAAYDEREGTVTVGTKNVASFAIVVDQLGEKRPATLKITVDGDVVDAPTDREILLGRDGDGPFRLLTSAPADKKRHGLSGPLDDVQNGPVTIVYGASDPAMVEANRMVAEHLATLGGSADIRYPVLSDDAATDAALAGRNVVLVGAPSQNRLVRAIAPTLPVRFEPGALVVRGERHEGDEVAVSLVFPGPEAFFGDGADRRGGRYVVLHAATGPRAALAARSLPRYLPDYVVYDAELAQRRGGLLMDGRPVRAAGFFDESWR
jgi:predicted esterase